jgi:membrane protein DedA with SNARE-associated domain
VPDSELVRDLLIAFGVFVSAGLGAPFPEELAIVAAGLWTASNPEHGVYRWLMLPVCLLGVLIADCLLYGIGRYFGGGLLRRPWFARLVPAAKRRRIEENFRHYGVSILLFGRLLPGIRAPLFLTSGMMHLSVPRFVVADAFGAVVGNSLLFFLAFWFGDQFRELVEHAERDVARARPLVILVLIVAVGVFFLIHFLRRPVPTGDPEELPLIGHQVAVHMDSTVLKRPPLPPGYKAGQAAGPPPHGEPNPAVENPG